MPSPKVLLTIATLMASAPALANIQPQMILCSSFEQKPDGAWSPTRPVTIRGPTGQVLMTPGLSFHPGSLFMGFDLGALVQQLERQCHSGEIQS
jgi:hypothetical protein